MDQISIFDRTTPFCVWEITPDNPRTSKSQGMIYCSRCGRLLGCTGFRSYVMSLEECVSESGREYFYDFPFCDCGAYVYGVGLRFDSYVVF